MELPLNWTESYPGGIATNNSANGGIIDKNISSNTWFIIFHNDIKPIENIESREKAFEIFKNTIDNQ